MIVSFASSRLNGFQKWSNDHPESSNDDDNPAGGATPIALVEPDTDTGAPENLRRRPWGIPGIGGAF